MTPTLTDGATRGQPPQQLRYARLLEWGTHLGVAVLVVSFLGGLSGLAPPQVPLDQLQQLWSLPVEQYLARTHSPGGWSWWALLHHSDALGLAGIAILAACPVLALLPLVPMYAVSRDRALAALCLLEAGVVLVVASDVLGH
jgi:hypothetical protein